MVLASREVELRYSSSFSEEQVSYSVLANTIIVDIDDTNL